MNLTKPPNLSAVHGAEEQPYRDRLRAFALTCREVLRTAGTGEAAMADVMDRFRVVGRATGLEETDIDKALATAARREAARAGQVALLAGTMPSNDSVGVHHSPSGYRPLSLRELLQMEIPPRQMLLDPILPERGLAMFYAPRGMGKTFLALSIAHAVASGGSILRWHGPMPRQVLYIDGEMPLVALQERLRAIVGPDQQAAPETFRLLAADHHDGGLPNLAMPDGQRAIEPLLDGVELVVLDNLSTLTSVDRDNDAESWTSMQHWLLGLRRRGTSVLFVHHAGKGGQQRGTSRREDVLDTVIALRKPKNYRAADGARFEVHYEKARGLFGEDAAPFEARLEMTAGRAHWSEAALVDADEEQVAELLKQRKSLREIARQTGMSKSKAARLKKKVSEETPPPAAADAA